MAFFLAEMIQRLGHSSPGVRRIAALDLMKPGVVPKDQARAVADALATGIDAETDQPTLLVLIRALGRHGDDSHRPALSRFRDDQETPAVVAHAAILAHDAIEGRSSYSA